MPQSIMLHARVGHRLAAAFGLLSSMGIASVAVAETATFEVVLETSSVTTGVAFTLPFSGSLLGDYDARSNPDGTQTRPGLFGGSGNNPIDCQIDLELASDPTPTVPSGGIELDLTDLAAGTISIDAFEIDLLSGGTAGIGGELVIVYETFNTINPFSIYPGGVAIPVPLADASILRSEIVLTDSVPATATPVKGGFEFVAVMVATWTLEFDPGTGTQLQQIPVAIPLNGTVLGEAGLRTLAIDATFSQSGSQPLDLPVGPIPVPLPTLPPGGTANLLFSGIVGAVAFDTSLDLGLNAVEVVVVDPADLNGDGRVDAGDIGLLIAAWGPCTDCPADLDGNGLVDAGDLGLMIAVWTF